MGGGSTSPNAFKGGKRDESCVQEDSPMTQFKTASSLGPEDAIFDASQVPAPHGINMMHRENSAASSDDIVYNRVDELKMATIMMGSKSLNPAKRRLNLMQQDVENSKNLKAQR